VQDITNLSSPNPHLAISAITPPVTAPERTLAALWARSGAPALVGYGTALLVTLARTNERLFQQLRTVDLDDPTAVLGAVQALQDWRRDVAARSGSLSFGHQARQQADAGTEDMTQLAAAA
jgi:hypothetical protein